jgi:dipeptidyl aminopeptidase/acylaminoacyl peptidase
VADVADVAAAVKHLAAAGLADPARAVIDGGSAGGFTTLAALAFQPDVFAAGTSLYGVADCSLLAADTHKFESRYLDSLIGPYPAAKATYDARSPINAVDRINAGLLLLQGDEDRIVPPNQATLIHDKLKARGVPTALIMYEGEQHGFRKAANIRSAYDSELWFYGKVLGFEPQGIEAGVRLPDGIANLVSVSVE